MRVRLEAVLRVEGENLPVTLADLHHEGARVLAPRWVRPATSALLVDPHHQRQGRSRLACLVAWAQVREGPDVPEQSGVVLGLQFEELVFDTWLYEALRKRQYAFPHSFVSRRTRRVEACLPFELQDKDCRALACGTTRDLSLGGTQVGLPFELPPQEMVRLVLVTSDLAPPLVLVSRVVSSQRWSSQFLHHLRFLPLVGEQRNQLTALLLTQLRIADNPVLLPEKPPEAGWDWE